MKNIKVNLPVILEVPDKRAEDILNGNITAFLSSIYIPDRHNENRGNGKWWVQGECIIENGKTINISE